MIILFPANLSTSLEVNTTVLFDVNRLPHVVVNIEVKCTPDSVCMTVFACMLCVCVSYYVCLCTCLCQWEQLSVVVVVLSSQPRVVSSIPTLFLLLWVTLFPSTVVGQGWISCANTTPVLLSLQCQMHWLILPFSSAQRVIVLTD